MSGDDYRVLNTEYVHNTKNGIEEMNDVEDNKEARTLLPRFSIRTLLVVVTLFALAFVLPATAVRGETWAWGVTIGLASIFLTALVHAAWFGIVWLFAQLPSTRPKDLG
jgi:hypothetical protein